MDRPVEQRPLTPEDENPQQAPPAVPTVSSALRVTATVRMNAPARRRTLTFKQETAEDTLSFLVEEPTANVTKHGDLEASTPTEDQKQSQPGEAALMVKPHEAIVEEKEDAMCNVAGKPAEGVGVPVQPSNDTRTVPDNCAHARLCM